VILFLGVKTLKIGLNVEKNGSKEQFVEEEIDTAFIRQRQEEWEERREAIGPIQ